VYIRVHLWIPIFSNKKIAKQTQFALSLQHRTPKTNPNKANVLASLAPARRSIATAKPVADNGEMTFTVSTRGFTDIIDITPQVQKACEAHHENEGVAHVFVVGATAALSTIEFEPGAVADLKNALERIAPMDAEYRHNEAWHDGNGYAHLRAALMKPSLSIPIVEGQLALGTWQQVILLDFDNRPRTRTIHVQVTSSS
jgi:secondary thiamine-phosphate synthase enzyme